MQNWGDKSKIGICVKQAEDKLLVFLIMVKQQPPYVAMQYVFFQRLMFTHCYVTDIVHMHSIWHDDKNT